MANDAHTLRLYNTLTRSKDEFVPIDPGNVRMYVCGPTVYDFAHIGNARPAIVFDVLFRLLRHAYGAEHVTYVRNITDVDDKINARAVRDYPGLPLNEAIRQVTEKTATQFQADVAALGCLDPTVQPRATENIDEMQTLIATLLQNHHAYEAGGEVLFDTASMPDYGQLSKRPLEENQAGARVAVDVHKRNPADFVLWKQSSAEEPGWESPWGRGRPGWHIECSAMSERYLGQVFDIHGGGLDLIFPHHENEIAQSRCAHGTHAMANVWMHNGFLQVEGKKMSKSLGNFVTIRQLLERWPGDVIRLNMLKAHYRQPIDWTETSLEQTQRELRDWTDLLAANGTQFTSSYNGAKVPRAIVESSTDDINTPAVLTILRSLFEVGKGDEDARAQLARALQFIGIRNVFKSGYFTQAVAYYKPPVSVISDGDISNYARRARIAQANAEFNTVSTVIGEALGKGLSLQFGVSGEIHIGFVAETETFEQRVGRLVAERLEALIGKDFAKADTIRAQLLDQGIQLMDYKDPATGERRTKWEVKR